MDSPSIARKKRKISAQTVEPFWRYSRSKYRGGGGRVYFEHFIVQCLSVNFHFLNNEKDYNKDFFTTGIIDDGLFFDGIKSYFSQNFSGSMLYTNSRRHIYMHRAKYRTTWSDQRTRIFWEWSYLKEHLKLRRISLKNIFGRKVFSTIYRYNLCLKKSFTLDISNTLLDNNPILWKLIPYYDRPLNSLQVYMWTSWVTLVHWSKYQAY